LKTIILSDHTRDQVLQFEAARAAEQRGNWSRYQDQLNRYYECRARVRQSLKDAWANRKPWQLIKAVFEWMAVRRRPVPQLMQMRPPSDRECAVAAGNQGEALVLRALEIALNDEWTVLRGYRNNMGEVDLIAVGPDGIAALEVKHVNGEIHCCQDQWWKDKWDNYRNLVEHGTVIQDRGGRSPSRQVNEVTDALEEFLAKRGLPYRIIRIVVLTHPKSEYGCMSELTVNWVCRLVDLNLPLACAVGRYKLCGAEIARAVSLIQKDHEFHRASLQRKRERVSTIAV
jgi:hypothetical protein